MPLYLDEIWVKADSGDSLARSYAAFAAIARSGGFPEGVTLVAGPWFSNEEPKIVLVLDIADHAKTFLAFGLAIAAGMLTRRRLTPVVGPAEVEALVAALG